MRLLLNVQVKPRFSFGEKEKVWHTTTSPRARAVTLLVQHHLTTVAKLELGKRRCAGVTEPKRRAVVGQFSNFVIKIASVPDL